MRKQFIAGLSLLLCPALRAPYAAEQRSRGERPGPAPAESASTNQPIRVDMPGAPIRSEELRPSWVLYFPPGSVEIRSAPRTAESVVTAPARSRSESAGRLSAPQTARSVVTPTGDRTAGDPSPSAPQTPDSVVRLLRGFLATATGTQLCDFLTENRFVVVDQDPDCDSDANGVTFRLRSADPLPLSLTILTRSYSQTIIPWVKYHFNLNDNSLQNRGRDPRIAARDLLEFWQRVEVWREREGVAIRHPEGSTGPLTLLFRRTEPDDLQQPAGGEKRFTLERLIFSSAPLPEPRE